MIGVINRQCVSPMTALEVYLEVSNCRRYASPSARAHLTRPPLETASSVSNRKGQSPAPSARVAHDGARGEQSQALSLEAICLALGARASCEAASRDGALSERSQGAITSAISACCPRRRSSVFVGEHRGPVLDSGTGLRRVRGMRAACVWPPLGGPLGVPSLGTHEARS